MGFYRKKRTQTRKRQRWINCRCCHLKIIWRKWPQLSSCGKSTLISWNVKKSSAPWLTFHSLSIVCQDFFSLALTARYNEFQATQRRLLRYISLRSHMFLWHKNTTYWDSAIHLGRFPSDILFSDQATLLKMILTDILWTTTLYGLIGRKRTLPTRPLWKRNVSICSCALMELVYKSENGLSADWWEQLELFSAGFSRLFCVVCQIMWSL